MDKIYEVFGFLPEVGTTSIKISDTVMVKAEISALSKKLKTTTAIEINRISSAPVPRSILEIT